MVYRDSAGINYCATVNGDTLEVRFDNTRDDVATRAIVLDVTDTYAIVAFQRQGETKSLTYISDFIPNTLTKIDFSEHPTIAGSYDIEYTGESGNGIEDLCNCSYIQDKWPASWINSCRGRSSFYKYYIYRIYL